ncbi:MAG: hypothetical protein AAF458_07575 [Pseudomonadota bacterium]
MEARTVELHQSPEVCETIRRHLIQGERMRAVASAAGAIAIMVAAATGADEPSYMVCEDQLRSYVTAELGQTVERLDIHWSYRGGAPEPQESSTAVVYVKECSGYHFFEVLATYEECTLVHYGTPPNYLFYRGANAGC